jgi:hypothetical protein
MTTFTHDRPTFRERVMALAGHSTWREPVGGHSTTMRQIPTDHLVAAALSFGRRGANDIGPDIAFDMATGRMGHKARVCEALGRAMAADRSRMVQRNRPVIGVIAWAAYCAVLGLPAVPRPQCVHEGDWGDLVAAGALILERLAEDALALAGRRARAAA